MGEWVIYGGGGHARVIADAIKLNAGHVINFFDDNKNLDQLAGKPVIAYHENQSPDAKIIIAIGNNEIRRDIVNYIVHDFGYIVHPDATVADDVLIGEGSVILAGAVVQSGAVIGRHVIINSNVTVDHDAVIHDFCSVYPNSYIGGGAEIGAGAVIEACFAVPRQAKVPAVFNTTGIELF